jgi:hypothetical protein
MRRQCHWLALGISVLMVVGALLLTQFRPSASHAESVVGESCSVPQDSYHSPQCCAECHPVKYQSWAQTAHARARVDPLFELDLQEQQQPGDCLCCHTTGYDASSGHYALPGVTCEACHAPYQPGHTTQQMAIAAPQEICRNCHVERFGEWEAGAHGETDKHCAACHTVHS